MGPVTPAACPSGRAARPRRPLGRLRNHRLSRQLRKLCPTMPDLVRVLRHRVKPLQASSVLWMTQSNNRKEVKTMNEKKSGIPETPRPANQPKSGHQQKPAPQLKPGVAQPAKRQPDWARSKTVYGVATPGRTDHRRKPSPASPSALPRSAVVKTAFGMAVALFQETGCVRQGPFRLFCCFPAS